MTWAATVLRTGFKEVGNTPALALKVNCTWNNQHALIRPSVTNIEMTVRTDCAAFTCRAPQLLSPSSYPTLFARRELAFGQMSALPTSAGIWNKANSPSTRLACLLTFGWWLSQTPHLLVTVCVVWGIKSHIYFFFSSKYLESERHTVKKMAQLLSKGPV